MMEKRKFYNFPGRALFFAMEDYAISEDKHCCSEMDLHIHADERIILYRAQTREYAIRASDSIVQIFFFCPWCGAKLPDGLSEELFDTIQKEYGLDIGSSELREDASLTILSDFKTDVWWKKRGF